MKKVSPREILRLKESCSQLGLDVARGGYDDKHLAALRKHVSQAEKLLGISHKVLADYANVTTSVMSNVKTGGRPKLINFHLICRGVVEAAKQNLIELGILYQINLKHLGDDSWVALDRYTNRGEIVHLTNLIEDMAHKFRASNALAESIPEREREELIAILESATQQLRGPLVEVSFFRQLGSRISEFGSYAGSKLGQEVVGEAAKRAAEALKNIF